MNDQVKRVAEVIRDVLVARLEGKKVDIDGVAQRIVDMLKADQPVLSPFEHQPGMQCNGKLTNSERE